jgi:broad specificity phosphatase PhoE
MADRRIPALQRWPSKLWLVWHGESAGNVARDAAHAASLTDIKLETRDIDVPLSARGEQQSEALGRWFRALAANARPEVEFSSPYLRARRIATLIERSSGFALGVSGCVVDERLREKEFGVLDRLTRLGIEQRYPEQATARRLIGKFYYRPPAGESWCDVILRLRAVLDTISLHCGGKRVLIGHQVVVLCMRYLLESMDEQTILAIDADGDVANCAVTEYEFEADREEGEGAGSLVLRRYNFVAPLVREGAPITREPDVNVAAR